MSIKFALENLRDHPGLEWLADNAEKELNELGVSVAVFLTHHKRKCPANQGHECTCGLFTAREHLRKVTGRAWDEQEAHA